MRSVFNRSFFGMSWGALYMQILTDLPVLFMNVVGLMLSLRKRFFVSLSS
jgi:hypothetical protein